jgi:hypothetical protein
LRIIDLEVFALILLTISGKNSTVTMGQENIKI